MILPNDALLCKDCSCTDVNHKHALNQFHDDMVAAVNMADQNTLHNHDVGRGNNHI